MSEPTLPPSPVDNLEDDEADYVYEAFDITDCSVFADFADKNKIEWDEQHADSRKWMKDIYKCLDMQTGGIPLAKCQTVEVDSNEKPVFRGCWGPARITALALGHWNKPPTEEEKQTVIKAFDLEPNVRTVKVKIPFSKGPEKTRNFYVHKIPFEDCARVREELNSPAVKKWIEENMKGTQTT